MEMPPQRSSESTPQSSQRLEATPSSSIYDVAYLNNRNLPANTPIMDTGSKMIDALLSDENVKEKLRKKYFFVFGRDNSLTFLDDERKASKIMSFDITKIDMLNATPYYDYTFDEEFEWNVMRNIFETKLDRSQGINESVKNERIIQQSQFSENRNIQSQEDGNEEAREGFLKRLLKKR